MYRIIAQAMSFFDCITFWLGILSAGISSGRAQSHTLVRQDHASLRVVMRSGTRFMLCRLLFAFRSRCGGGQDRPIIH